MRFFNFNHLKICFVLLGVVLVCFLNSCGIYKPVDARKVSPNAKLLPENATAKDLAEIIHQDIAKGFLHAIDAKTKQRIGADHQLKNGDVIKIVSSLSRR